MGDKTYPRVLIVLGHPVSKTSGTGVTLANLFHGWPAESLAQVHFEPPSGTEYCTFAHSFEVSAKCAPIDALMRNMMRRPGSTLLRGAPENAASALPKGRHVSFNAWLHVQARATADLSPLIIRRDLIRWVADFDPQVIYTHLGSIRIMRLVNSLARSGSYRVVPHFMDDWPESMYCDHPLCGIARYALIKELRKTLGISSGGLCISQSMAREYERRYALPFTDFMNCVDDSWFLDEVASYSAGTNRIRFVYCGGLHLGRDKVLLKVAEAISRINCVKPVAELDLYVPPTHLQQHASTFLHMDWVKLGSLTSNEVPGVLKRADVNVHVESFDPENIPYTRYSISTKIPQYLACGRPILAIGPAELASMEHLKCSGGAILVSESCAVGVERGISTMLDPEQRVALGRHGRAFAVSRHSANSVRLAFRNVLKDLIKASL